MQRVREVAGPGKIYLLRHQRQSVPAGGPETIMYRVLEALRWEVPTGSSYQAATCNSSAFGKAFIELKQLGAIKAHCSDHQRGRINTLSAGIKAGPALERRPQARPGF